MMTIAMLIYSAKTGARIDGALALVLADVLITWFIMKGLVKIFGGF
jgi:hypothetical protein